MIERICRRREKKVQRLNRTKTGQILMVGGGRREYKNKL